MRLLFLFLLSTGQICAAEKPNILVFMADDHGMLDSSPYGAKDVRTPQMQALADAGCKFTHAFIASPSCAPSRAAMLTGLMPARNGAEANHTYKKDGIESLPERLRKAGYETAAFGKIAHGKDAPRHGFDHISPNHHARDVEAWLSKRTSGKPLALFVGTHEPHVPWPDLTGYDPKTVVLPPTFVDTPATREFRARYYTDVTKADTNLGAVRALAKAKLGAGTIVFYTSDHGAQWPFSKWNLYDAGIRVPLLVEWPGVVKPKTTSDALVQSIDLFPTLIDIVGGEVPKDIDGRSYAGVLRGTTDKHREEIFTTHSGDGKDKNVTPMRALRKNNFKYILNLYPAHEYATHIDRVQTVDGGYYWKSWEEAAKSDPRAAAVMKRYRERPSEELYDLAADPNEMTNLAGEAKYAATLKAMRAELEAWMVKQNDSRKFFGTPTYLPGKK